jgi:two-component system sensor histidine kinase CpxA
MRSIVSKVLLWFVFTVAVSLAGLGATSMILSARLPEHFDFMSKTQQLQLDGAVQAYEDGGPERLRNYLRRINELYYADHILVDRNGKDLADGTDRSDLVARGAWRPWPRQPRNGRIVLSRASADRRYRLLILIPPPVGPWFFFPYFLWIVLVVVALGYVLAMHMARPLRGLRQAVERFGRGDLSARFGSDRRDEIGQLAAAFNQMAARIETLLTAERRLLQDVSHELRSPLTRLGFALELARTADDREASLARARKESGRLADLVDELLQLTRAEGDPGARIREDVELADLLDELAADGQVEAQAKGCRLVVRSARAVCVSGDRELLRRAIDNVIRNAIRHAPEGTPIEVDLSLRDELARIEIRDHGPGVPEPLLDEVFRPFVRVEDDRNRTSGGVGLGLAIARRAVELHHGTIRARNAAPGLAIAIDIPGATDGAPIAGGIVEGAVPLPSLG